MYIVFTFFYFNTGLMLGPNLLASRLELLTNWYYIELLHSSQGNCFFTLRLHLCWCDEGWYSVNGKLYRLWCCDPPLLLVPSGLTKTSSTHQELSWTWPSTWAAWASTSGRNCRTMSNTVSAWHSAAIPSSLKVVSLLLYLTFYPVEQRQDVVLVHH